MMSKNSGCPLDLEWISKTRVNAWCVHDAVRDIPLENRLGGRYRAAWLLRAVSCIDLTTLSADDTHGNVARMCRKAMKPVKTCILQELGFAVEDDKPFTTAAVCVYPARVRDAAETIGCAQGVAELQVAAVATGFPSGQYGLKSRLLEIEYAVEEGATEIDVVIDRSLALTGKWDALYHELKEMKKACGEAKMKTILAVGELANYENVYKASLIAMMAGSDFIKTSTGKETVNATLEFGLVMMRAIREYNDRTSNSVGFKAAGGIKTAGDALNWLILLKRELGRNYLNKNLFRIGASSLLSDIERDLYVTAYDRYPAEYEFTLG